MCLDSERNCDGPLLTPLFAPSGNKETDFIQSHPILIISVLKVTIGETNLQNF